MVNQIYITVTSKIIYNQIYAQKDQKSSTSQTPISAIFFSSPTLGTTTQTAWMGKRSNAAEPTSVPGPKPINKRNGKILQTMNTSSLQMYHEQ